MDLPCVRKLESIPNCPVDSTTREQKLKWIRGFVDDKMKKRSGKKITARPKEDELYKYPRTRNAAVTCLAFGKNRKKEYPKFFFCDACDKFEDAITNGNKRAKRSQLKYICAGGHEGNRDHPTTLMQPYRSGQQGVLVIGEVSSDYDTFDDLRLRAQNKEEGATETWSKGDHNKGSPLTKSPAKKKTRRGSNSPFETPIPAMNERKHRDEGLRGSREVRGVARRINHNKEDDEINSKFASLLSFADDYPDDAQSQQHSNDEPNNNDQPAEEEDTAADCWYDSDDEYPCGSDDSDIKERNAVLRLSEVEQNASIAIQGLKHQKVLYVN